MIVFPHKIAVIGTGLIGGSFALAIRRAVPDIALAVCDSNLAALTHSFAGIATQITDSPRIAVADADMVVLAVPVGQIASVLAEILPVLKTDAIVTDVGSTKADVIEAARQAMAAGSQYAGHFSRFVAGHPIAGGEKHGPAAARAELFKSRTVVLTPGDDTDTNALRMVETCWRAIGARVVRLDAVAHDQVFAAVSHLPHLLAFALVDELGGRDNAEQLFSFAGAGFRDFTRIAASSPEVWRDISLANRTALLNELDHYADRLACVREALEQGDGVALETMFRHSQQHRSGWRLPDADGSDVNE